MIATAHHFLQPLDVLFLRGNKLFGDPGSFGESLIPPWPSVAAGALRSHLLAAEGIDFTEFANGRAPHPALGTPAQPGPFTVTAFHLARRYADGRIDTLHAVPADLVIGKADDDKPVVRRLVPVILAAGLSSSAPLARLPVLPEKQRGKPETGYWLTQAGWQAYLSGDTPKPAQLIESTRLWKIDPRVGVGLDADMRRAADGKLFSVQAVAMATSETAFANTGTEPRFDVGFLVGVAGADIPPGVVRLGGDGRAANLRPADSEWQMPQPDFTALLQARRCRIVLTTPGIFPEGWKLPGVDTDNRLDLAGVRARLVCAAVPRYEVVSGWDLAKWQPKPAQRVAPTGSVYWLDELDATPEQFGKLAEAGLWTNEAHNASRRAEGFNRFTFAAF